MWHLHSTTTTESKPFRIFYGHLVVTINKCNYRFALWSPTNTFYLKCFFFCYAIVPLPYQLWHTFASEFQIRWCSVKREHNSHMAHKLNRILVIVHEGTIDPIVHYFQSIFISFYETITLKYGHHFFQIKCQEVFLCSRFLHFYFFISLSL